jgi:hypothetical protein
MKANLGFDDISSEDLGHSTWMEGNRMLKGKMVKESGAKMEGIKSKPKPKPKIRSVWHEIRLG